MQWGLCKYVLSKKVKAGIFKSALAIRKSIVVFSPEICNILEHIQTWSLNAKNNLRLYQQ